MVLPVWNDGIGVEEGLSRSMSLSHVPVVAENLNEVQGKSKICSE